MPAPVSILRHCKPRHGVILTSGKLRLMAAHGWQQRVRIKEVKTESIWKLSDNTVILIFSKQNLVPEYFKLCRILLSTFQGL